MILGYINGLDKVIPFSLPSFSCLPLYCHTVINGKNAIKKVIVKTIKPVGKNIMHAAVAPSTMVLLDEDTKRVMISASTPLFVADLQWLKFSLGCSEIDLRSV